MAAQNRRAHLRLIRGSTAASSAYVEETTDGRDHEGSSAVNAEPTWTHAAPAPPSTAKPRRGKAAEPTPGGGGLAELSDGQLVVLATRGEARALEPLYRRHAAFAIHLATCIEGSARDVEDIVHDAFVRAFERIGDLADPTAFRSWLGSIVIHAVRSRLRRHRLMSVLGLRGGDPIDLDTIASPSASPEARAQLAQVYALLRTLNADDRIAWTLRVIDGHELDTVARLARCSLATVKRRITRAQRFLDEHFIPLKKQPEGDTP